MGGILQLWDSNMFFIIQANNGQKIVNAQKECRKKTRNVGKPCCCVFSIDIVKIGYNYDWYQSIVVNVENKPCSEHVFTGYYYLPGHAIKEDLKDRKCCY
jgi:hypothetical protein